MPSINYGRGYVYSLKYHLVWCVKYRKPILQGDIDKDLKFVINQIAEDNDIEILQMETDRDHIHLLIECKPQHTIPNFVKAFKGTSARYLFKHHPELKNQLYKGYMWNPSYFISTVSENSEANIKEYIKTQKEYSYVKPQSV